MIFQIEVETEGREVYCIDAPSEEEARRIFDGESGKPVVSEVTSAWIIRVEKIE